MRLSPETFNKLSSGVILDIHGVPVSGSQLKFNRTTGAAYRPKEHKQRVFTIYEYALDYVEKRGLEKPIFKQGTPLSIQVQFYFPYRKIDYRTGKNAHMLKEAAPTYVLGNKDLDNLLKPLKDGLKGVIFSDDKQIVQYTNIIKMYSESPRTEITIREIVEYV